MILELTLACNEMCSHCMVDAVPTGRHMSDKTLAKVIHFLMRHENKPNILQISGGEFTLHPSFFSAVMLLAGYLPDTPLILESNGSFWFDADKKQRVKELLHMSNIVSLQIRTDKRYYPNYERTIASKDEIEAWDEKAAVLEGEISLVPMGRAKNLIETNPDKSPQCVNFIMFNKQRDFKTLKEFMDLYNSMGKVCSPMIDVDGNLHAGESCLCKPFAKVTDTNDEIVRGMKAHDFCGKCNLKVNFNNLRTL
jgi:hypothetical protein